MKRRHLFWFLSFIALVLILAGLWTTTNVYFYQKYTELSFQLKGLVDREKLQDLNAPITWMSLYLGLGFGLGLLGIAVFFFRLLSEMKLSQMQKEFLARISHELQSPVSSLELSASLLSKKGIEISEEEKISLWEIHDSELKRLRVEIESLLEASRWEHKGFRPQFENIYLQDWLGQAFPVWEKIVGPSGRMSLKGDKMDLNVRIDPRILSLVTNNLVDNARKFSKGGELILEVYTHIFQGKKGSAKWLLEFKDNGVGFSPEQSRKIFKRYERISPKSSKPGYGIGLFLVRSACKGMGLQVTANSEGSGKGAQFVISGKGELRL